MALVVIPTFLFIVMQLRAPQYTVRSRLYMSEQTPNVDRKPAANERYYPVYVRIDSRWKPALLTRDDILVAIERAEKNPEDVLPRRQFWQLD